MATSRLPDAQEMSDMRELLASQREYFNSDPAKAKEFLEISAVPFDIPNTEAAAWGNMMRAITNLYETLTRN